MVQSDGFSEASSYLGQLSLFGHFIVDYGLRLKSVPRILRIDGRHFYYALVRYQKTSTNYSYYDRGCSTCRATVWSWDIMLIAECWNMKCMCALPNDKKSMSFIMGNNRVQKRIQVGLDPLHGRQDIWGRAFYTQCIWTWRDSGVTSQTHTIIPSPKELKSSWFLRTVGSCVL